MRRLHAPLELPGCLVASSVVSTPISALRQGHVSSSGPPGWSKSSSACFASTQATGAGVQTSRQAPAAGQILELNCTALAFGGQGICRQDDGFVIFCNAALPGEKLLAEVSAVKKGHAVATKVKTLHAHDAAVQAPCPHFGPCGGCTLQNLDYSAQLAAKREWVVSALQRIGGFTNAESLVVPVVPCQEPFRYRNNMRFSFGPPHAATPEMTNEPSSSAGAPLALGLHPRGLGTSVLPVSTCHLQDPVADQILQIVSDWAKTLPPEPAAQPTSVSAASSEESQAPALEPTTGASSDGQADHQGNDAVPHASARQRESHRGRGRRGSQTPRHRQGSVNSSSEQPQQFLQELVIRRGHAEDGQATFLVDLITSYHAPDRLQHVASTIQASVPSAKSIMNTVTPRHRSRDVKTYPVRGPHFLRERLCGLEFRISPRSFFQTNSAQTEILYGIVARLAGLRAAAPSHESSGSDLAMTEQQQSWLPAEGVHGRSQPVLWDLYCGIGTIGLSLASQCHQVIGIDGAGGGIADASRNARHNGISNASFMQLDLASRDLATRLNMLPQPDIVVADPARAGMGRTLLQYLRGCSATRIVYVSCDPSSQARDLCQLTADESSDGTKGNAWTLVPGVVPCDMFPHTAHVENVALLKRC